MHTLPLKLYYIIKIFNINGGKFMMTYTVQPGDTLYTIANKYGVSVEEILRYNGIVLADDLYVGDILRIPNGNPRVPRWYIVRPGDSIFSIANKYNLSLPILLELNPLDNPDLIVPGQVIKLR